MFSEDNDNPDEKCNTLVENWVSSATNTPFANVQQLSACSFLLSQQRRHGGSCSAEAQPHHHRQLEKGKDSAR